MRIIALPAGGVGAGAIGSLEPEVGAGVDGALDEGAGVLELGSEGVLMPDPSDDGSADPVGAPMLLEQPAAIIRIERSELVLQIVFMRFFSLEAARESQACVSRRAGSRIGSRAHTLEPCERHDASRAWPSWQTVDLRTRAPGQRRARRFIYPSKMLSTAD
jgi:hypothetical protein